MEVDDRLETQPGRHRHAEAAAFVEDVAESLDHLILTMPDVTLEHRPFILAAEGPLEGGDHQPQWCLQEQPGHWEYLARLDAARADDLHTLAERRQHAPDQFAVAHHGRRRSRLEHRPDRRGLLDAMGDEPITDAILDDRRKAGLADGSGSALETRRRATVHLTEPRVLGEDDGLDDAVRTSAADGMRKAVEDAVRRDRTGECLVSLPQVREHQHVGVVVPFSQLGQRRAELMRPDRHDDQEPHRTTSRG